MLFEECIFLSSDRISEVSLLIGPPVSIAIGTVISIGDAGIFVLFAAALVAAAPVHSAVSI